MSRPLLFGVLVILVALLAVMANVVSPKPKEETPEQQAASTEQQQKQREEMMKQEREERQKMMRARAEAAKKQAAAAEDIQPAPMGKIPRLPPPSATSMKDPSTIDVSSSWFRERKEGDEGIKEMDAVVKAWEEARKKQGGSRGAPAPAPGPPPIGR